MNNERYLAEFKPAYRLQHEEPAPLGTKCIFLSPYGSAVIGHWYEGCGFVAWAPLLLWQRLPLTYTPSSLLKNQRY